MSDNPYRWVSIPGVVYPEPNAAKPKAATPKKAAKPKKPRKSRRDYEHPLFVKNPTLYTKYGVRRKVPITPFPSELEWCTAKEAMKILSCGRSTVDAIVKKYSIPTRKCSYLRPSGNGATAFMYFYRDDVIMAAKLRSIDKNKSLKNHA
jgi:hypothetical protein